MDNTAYHSAAAGADALVMLKIYRNSWWACARGLKAIEFLADNAGALRRRPADDDA
ncbi:MAG: hypothetical protein H6527_06585 [Actinobacteria bacterium]|nr:hypothetical protein [Actinomycetota bacterium]